jgi:hypothetical protein
MTAGTHQESGTNREPAMAIAGALEALQKFHRAASGEWVESNPLNKHLVQKDSPVADRCRARGLAEHDMAAIVEVVRDLSSEEKHK